MLTMTIDLVPKYVRSHTVVDFAQIIRDMRAGGYRLQRISLVTGIPRTNLCRYLFDDALPSHRYGEELIGAWCFLLGRQRAQVPTRHPILSASKVCS